MNESTPEILILIISTMGALIIFFVKSLLNRVTQEIESLKKEISNINVTLAINSHAIKFMNDSIKK